MRSIDLEDVEFPIVNVVSDNRYRRLTIKEARICSAARPGIAPSTF